MSPYLYKQATFFKLSAFISLAVIFNLAWATNAHAGKIVINTPNFSVGYKNHGHHHSRSYKRYPKRHYYRDHYYQDDYYSDRYDRRRYNRHNYNDRRYRRYEQRYYDDYSYNRCPSPGFSLHATLGLDCYPHKGHFHCR